jgi:hypothetical protein
MPKGTRLACQRVGSAALQNILDSTLPTSVDNNLGTLVLRQTYSLPILPYPISPRFVPFLTLTLPALPHGGPHIDCPTTRQFFLTELSGKETL